MLKTSLYLLGGQPWVTQVVISRVACRDMDLVSRECRLLSLVEIVQSVTSCEMTLVGAKLCVIICVVKKKSARMTESKKKD